MKVDLATISSDLSSLVPVVGQLVSAYNAYKLIWTAINPGKTEADYENHLSDLSNANISAADAILIGDGYVKDTLGNWSKPPKV